MWWLIKQSKTLFKSQKSYKRWHRKKCPGSLYFTLLQMPWKPGCASVVYNHIIHKDFRLCRCRILKSNFTDIVKARLCECSVQWYHRKDIRLCRCKPLKSFSERVKKSGWMSAAFNSLVSTDFRLCRCSVAHVKYCCWIRSSCRFCSRYLEI